MPFFQNPFAKEFQGYWLLGDRHHAPTFKVAANPGRGTKHVTAWTPGPYDMSGNDTDGNSADTLVIRFALRGEPIWGTLSIDVAAGASSSSAVTADEIATNLNADPTFAGRFKCEFTKFDNGQDRLNIFSKADETQIQFYIVNGRAEEKIGFNGRAAIAELPNYFSRQTVENQIAGEITSEGMLVQLDPANNVDAALIDNAVDAYGKSKEFDSGTVQDDWELLKGRSGLFQFQKGPSANSIASTETTILYPAGARVGDLSTKVVTRRDSGGDIVEKFEMPYVLTGSDLITPP